MVYVEGTAIRMAFFGCVTEETFFQSEDWVEKMWGETFYSDEPPNAAMKCSVRFLGIGLMQCWMQCQDDILIPYACREAACINQWAYIVW